MEKATQELNQAKELFFKGVNANFEVPLLESLDLIESMMHKRNDAALSQLHEKLTAVHKNSENIKTMALLKSGAIEHKVITVKSLPFFETITRAFFKEAKAEEITYLIYLDPNMPKTITLDAKYVTDILNNLIHNAILFTPKGGTVFVDIRIKSKTSKAAQLHASITDTGKGITKAALQKLVRPFESTTQERLGLGLSTAYFLLKKMKASLKIASEIDKGSRFSFVLDIQADENRIIDLPSELKIGVYIEGTPLFAYTKHLYQYLISLGISVVSITDKEDASIASCHAVFIVGTKSMQETIKLFMSQNRALICIPTKVYGDPEDTHTLSLPAMPLQLYALLKSVATTIAKDTSDLAPTALKPLWAPNEPALSDITVPGVAEERAAYGEKIKILIVEDNKINLKLVKAVLARYDFEVSQAENGQIALDMCHEERYDLILMDIDMPIMDGITATNAIKAYQQLEGIEMTHIIALTSHDLIGEREQIMEAGLDEHMPKPLNVSRLEFLLENYLGSAALRKRAS